MARKMNLNNILSKKSLFRCAGKEMEFTFDGGLFCRCNIEKKEQLCYNIQRLYPIYINI